MGETLDRLLNEVRLRAFCVADLPLGPRPIVQLGREARILIIGQAPGSKVRARSGVPWRDASGDRLREWMRIDNDTFNDDKCVAIVPMGFCYPARERARTCRPAPNARRSGTGGSCLICMSCD